MVHQVPQTGYDALHVSSTTSQKLDSVSTRSTNSAMRWTVMCTTLSFFTGDVSCSPIYTDACVKLLNDALLVNVSN
jgi:hypothetical protein